MSIYNIPVKDITGHDTSLAQFEGSVMLIVNVASKCGLTKQYEGLEKLYHDYNGQGLVVAGFPANDFMCQEPGTNDEIAAFCKGTFGIDFPLFAKISVVGAEKHPLYKALIEAQPKTANSSAGFREKLKGHGINANAEPEILWNFEKFLISRDGEVVARFSPDTTADDPALVEAVKAELAKK